jgi:hypothetical protein
VRAAIGGQVDENIILIDKHYYIQRDTLLYQAHQTQDGSDMWKWGLVMVNRGDGQKVNPIPHSIIGYAQKSDGQWVMILAPGPDDNGKPTFRIYPEFDPGELRHIGASHRPNFDQATEILVDGYFYHFGDTLVKAKSAESMWSLFIVNPEDGHTLDSEPGRLLFYSLDSDGHWYEAIDLEKDKYPAVRTGQRVDIDITKLEFVAEDREAYLNNRNFLELMRDMEW